jgi:hypothetical protein
MSCEKFKKNRDTPWTEGRGGGDGKGQVMVAREAGMARESRAQKQREQREGRSDARGWAMTEPEWEAALMGSCFLEATHACLRLRLADRGNSLAQLNPHQPHLSITRPVVHMGYPYPY